MSSFAGFPDDFFAFFSDLARNNSREWFADNKDHYRAVVVEPMVAFIEAMAPRLADVSPHYVADPRPNGGSMFRIHRDIRFSKDKRPYKEHGACHFRHEAGRDAHAPGFYVHLEPGAVLYGGGIWKPPKPALERIRQAIAEDAESWRLVVEDKGLTACFGAVAGDGLKRPPRGFPPDHAHIDDLKRQTFFVMHRTGPDEAGSAGFPDRVADAFRSATPLMRFLNTALEVPF